MVDASHGNSEKKFANQSIVVNGIARQIQEGAKNILGLMIESHLREGSQSYTPGEDNPQDLEYGKSITDGCVWLEVTAHMLETLSQASKLA